MTFPDGLSEKDLQMPFSEGEKLCILSFSIVFLLLGLAVLLWQTFRCCTRSSPLLGPDGSVPSDATSDLQTSSYKAQKWSSQQSLGWPSSPDPSSCDEIQQAKVRGSLLFSLYYDRVQSKLVVTVLQAQGLEGRDPSQAVHPFVWVRLLRAGPAAEGRRLQRVQQEWQSRVVKDSLSPSFGDQFSCSLEREDLAQSTVRLEVRDHDAFSRQESLGEVRIALGHLNLTSYPLELLKDLHPPRKDLVGEVLLSLRLLPTSQRLEVGLLKIRTLPPHKNTQKVLNARVSVQCNQGQLRHQKTEAQPHEELTVFNQVLPFSLLDPDIYQCSILVALYQSRAGRKSSRRLIGQMTLGKGGAYEDQHWNSMMQSVRQPIAQWHQLLI